MRFAGADARKVRTEQMGQNKAIDVYAPLIALNGERRRNVCTILTFSLKIRIY